MSIKLAQGKKKNTQSDEGSKRVVDLMMAKKMFNAQTKLKINERGATAFGIMFTAAKKLWKWVRETERERQSIIFLLSIYTFHLTFCVRAEVNVSSCSGFTTRWKILTLMEKVTTVEQFLKIAIGFVMFDVGGSAKASGKFVELTILRSQFAFRSIFSLISFFLNWQLRCSWMNKHWRWHITVILFNWKEQFCRNLQRLEKMKRISTTIIRKLNDWTFELQ